MNGLATDISNFLSTYSTFSPVIMSFIARTMSSTTRFQIFHLNDFANSVSLLYSSGIYQTDEQCSVNFLSLQLDNLNRLRATLVPRLILHRALTTCFSSSQWASIILPLPSLSCKHVAFGHYWKQPFCPPYYLPLKRPFHGVCLQQLLSPSQQGRLSMPQLQVRILISIFLTPYLLHFSRHHVLHGRNY